ncbi:MAG: glycosyltransferase [Candidatus Aenigmarchaeota archaeon]|nr:glycosyltransferase [Candidatus Aenigmarchaeota archaeon]
MTKISVTIPAYNKAEVVSKTIEETQNVFRKNKSDFEIIVMDDGSNDNTYEEALKTARKYDNVIVKRTEKNNGKGHALREAFKYTTGDLILFLDADLDIHPRQFNVFMQHLNDHEADVVIGSKRHVQSRIIFPLRRRIFSQMYHIFTKLFFKLPVGDTQSGMKLFKREVLKKIFPKVLVKRWAFDVELLLNANIRKFKIVEAPIDLNFRRFGSAIGLKAIYNMFLDTLAIAYRLKILRYYTRKINEEI